MIITLFDSFSIRPFVYWGGLFIFGAEKHQLILNMKKLFVLAAAAIMVLFAGCNKENGASEEGQWFCYENDGQATRLYLELKGGKADMIITAWGVRYKGDYTYNDGTVTITYKSGGCLTRYVGGEEPEKATSISNLFNDWPGPTSADHVIFSSPIKFGFDVDGDKALFNYEDANGSIRYEMTRKK